MSTKLSRLATTHYILLARGFVVILGCIAVWWGIVEFPVFWQESSAQRIAYQIIAGDPYKVETLAQQLAIISSIERSAYCRPAALRSRAIIQLRMLDVAASANDRKHIDENLQSLGNVIRSSLSCGPADPFLWLALYWVESTKNGSRPEYLNYLRMSYRLGPNEGWIALKRNGLALAEFDKLPADISVSAINEFISLLESGFYEQLADTFIAQTSRVREKLLLRLQDIDEGHRRAFANVVYAKSDDVVVPGIERPGSHPKH
jgi:hypothetical protein